MWNLTISAHGLRFLTTFYRQSYNQTWPSYGRHWRTASDVVCNMDYRHKKAEYLFFRV